MTDINIEESANESPEWEVVQPAVNAEAEFYEILNDFGNPLEILREAISNSIDAQATWVRISFDVEEIEGNNRLIIVLSDNGYGMSREVLKRDFWGLGHSPSRGQKDKIGEKGHGTKIYFRSEHITIHTQNSDGAYQSECERPLAKLARKQLHQPWLKPIDNFQDHTGTEIKIIGYNDNERSKFIQDVVKDYLRWFTKIGSIEPMFDNDTYQDFKVHLKCLDVDKFEEIPFGHVFPEESSDIDKLFEEKETGAADWYVKRYVEPEGRLSKHPEVTFQAIISVEGDEVKRQYNPMIRERRRSDTGRYRVSDRYGIWLCKDYIPITRVNEWITGFGSGSNAYVLLHGFINCQKLKLTANRGTIANTDPEILEELQEEVKQLVDQVDTDLHREGLYILRGWQQEARTLQQEKAEFDRRIKNLKGRKVAQLEDRLLVEPHNESELFGLLITVYALHPELFDFEPLDYNTNRGIDIIAQNKSGNHIMEGEHSYIELKHTLSKDFNHAYKYIRWIICWDFDRSVSHGTEFRGVEESDIRRLNIEQDEDDSHVYFLDNKQKAAKIQVIRLKEYLKQQLDIEFVARN